jgi:hypothetical protein
MEIHDKHPFGSHAAHTSVLITSLLLVRHGHFDSSRIPERSLENKVRKCHFNLQLYYCEAKRGMIGLVIVSLSVARFVAFLFCCFSSSIHSLSNSKIENCHVFTRRLRNEQTRLRVPAVASRQRHVCRLRRTPSRLGFPNVWHFLLLSVQRTTSVGRN